MNSDIQSMFKTVVALDTSKSFNKLSSLVWFPDFNVGWYPVVEDGMYDSDYFERYLVYKQSEVGVSLNRFRDRFVRRHTDLPPIDIGACAGHFIETYGGKAKGFDINPFVVAYLQRTGRYINVDTLSEVDCLTFWDSLEHICDFWKLLEKVCIGGYVFMTIPIFKNCDVIRDSRHFRPREHYWYPTECGIVQIMDALGFDLLEKKKTEVYYGRKGVCSYAFKRISRKE